eukprot:TRINITY_DN7006_c0_g1_i2.p1 TRINITY_DN7006_c0_g1~~TRINITY_DN7006_c0_g1_i2.p1  ORF type:complete len:238 (+),score=20.95 TRINITY_DN7006_c0_g1_i2:257-970(+)
MVVAQQPMSSRSASLNISKRGTAFNANHEHGVSAEEGLSLSGERGGSTASPSVHREINKGSSISSSSYTDGTLSSFDGDDESSCNDDHNSQSATPLGEGTIKTDMANTMGLAADHFDDIPFQDVLSMIPVGEDGELTSVGSVLHQSGSCMPCLFFVKSTCRKKFHCRYCHIPHSNGKSKRFPSPRKSTPNDSEPLRGSSEVAASNVIESKYEQSSGCSTRDVDSSRQRNLRVTRYSL